MKLATCLFAAVLGLGAQCAESRSVNPKRLTAVTPPVEYRLAVDVPVEGYNITFTLRAGRYLLSYKDAKGAYLIGEGQCMHWDIHSPKVKSTNDFPCGIYLPHDASCGASFFVVRAKTGANAAAGLVVNAIIRYNYGSFDWPGKAESQELRAALQLLQP